MSVRPRLLLVTLAALGLVALTFIVAGRGRSSHAPRTLEVEMRASAGTSARLFWAADQRFADDRSIRVPLQPAAEGFQRLRFRLPPDGIRWLRFDPTDGPGDVFIAGVRLLDSNDRVLATFDPQSFRPTNHIASITRQGEVTKIATTPAATNPILVLEFGRLDRFSPWESLSLVTPVSLALACVAVIVLLGASVLTIGRAAFEPATDVGPSQAPAPSRWRAALWLTALFLLAFSAKLVLVGGNTVTAPYWDQWDAEGSTLFVPFSESSLSWPMMFDLQNEHRPLLTRLYALALLEVNGQWDPQLETAMNAAIHSFTAVVLASIFWISHKRRRLDLFVVICAAVFVLQFAWENTLLPFQSPFYFLLLFSVLALWLTTTYRVGTAPWWLGWLCAVCAIFCNGGGVVAPVAIGGMVALKLADRWEWRQAVINGGAAGLVLALGIAVRSPPLAYHDFLRAKTSADFLGALTQNLAWPWIDHPRLVVVMWLPLAALLAVAALRRAKTTELERLVVGLGIWVAVTAGAMAYARGAGAALPATRYMDVLSLGFVANAVALVALLDRTRAGTAAGRVALGTLVVWLSFAIVGVDRLAGRASTELNMWRQFFVTEASNVRRFMIAGNVTELVAKQPLVELPHPSPALLAVALQHPVIRRILPAAVREPLHVEPRVNTNNAFVLDGPYAGSIPRDPLQRAWWSLSEEGRRAKGRFESQPLACQLGGRLKFEVAGYLGWEHQYLALKDLRTGRDVPIVPAKIAREGWTDVSVPCPPGPFEIVAIDDTDSSWFGFREPIEIGWASVVAGSLIRMSRDTLVVLLTLAVLVLGVRWT